jgi:hypothetical protein
VPAINPRHTTAINLRIIVIADLQDQNCSLRKVDPSEAFTRKTR